MRNKNDWIDITDDIRMPIRRFRTMTQVISRDGVVICITSVPYQDWIIRDMKKYGYKIKNV